MAEGAALHWQVRKVDARNVDARDVEALALVGAATFLETFAGVLDGGAIVSHCRTQHSVAAYKAYLACGATAWIAEAENGAPVGYALIAATDLVGSDPARDVELKRIYSLSRFHGSGLGAELMRCAVVAAVQRADRLLLGVYSRNHRALEFYRKQGFVQIGERTFRVGDQEYDDVVLARSLSVQDF